MPIHSEKRAKKKRQRTTFSMFEVRELEEAYMWRPYMMPEDEEDLVKMIRDHSQESESFKIDEPSHEEKRKR